MKAPEGPDMTGKRVRAYWKSLQHAKWMVDMNRVFCSAGHQSHQFINLCAEGVDAKIVQSVSDMMAKDECSALFEQVRPF